MRTLKLIAYLAVALLLPFYLFLTSNRDFNEKDKRERLDSLTRARQESINNALTKILTILSKIEADSLSTVRKAVPTQLYENDKLLADLIKVSIANANMTQKGLNSPNKFDFILPNPEIKLTGTVTTIQGPVAGGGKQAVFDAGVSNYDLSAKGPFPSWRATIVKKQQLQPYCYNFQINNANSDFEVLFNKNIEKSDEPPAPGAKTQQSYIQIFRFTDTKLDTLKPANQAVLCLNIDSNLQDGIYYFFLSGKMTEITKKRRKKEVPFRIPIIVTIEG